MNRDRLTAFSDGVIAIIITIMVLELRPPPGAEWLDLLATLPFFLTYTLSFIYVAIYWNNHHHLLHTVHHVTGAIMWANLHLLFWLSLTPFATAWLGAHYHAAVPTAVYGGSLLASAIAYYILQYAIIAGEGHGSVLALALGRDIKGKLSPLLYTVSVGAAFIKPFLSDVIFALVALIWLVPDRRIERRLVRGGEHD